MISKSNGVYILECDICGDIADEEFDDFYDAVEYKKTNEWKSTKESGDWEDVCPSCQ